MMSRHFIARGFTLLIQDVTAIHKIKNNEAHIFAKNAFEKYSNLAYALFLTSYLLSLFSSFLTQTLIHVTFLSHHSFLSITSEQGITHGNVTNSMLPDDNITKIFQFSICPFFNFLPSLFIFFLSYPNSNSCNIFKPSQFPVYYN
jgi:hypothetical protein